MAWWEDVAPRRKNRVNMATTITRNDARELDKIGDILVLEGRLKENNPYQIVQFALLLLRETMKKKYGRLD
ncbi:MAG: hypothetical protein WC565_03270 [Parcubacteria group bacterium]